MFPLCVVDLKSLRLLCNHKIFVGLLNDDIIIITNNSILQFVQSKLDLDLKHMQALMDGDLVTFNGISECTAAAYALHKCMNAEIHPC